MRPRRSTALHARPLALFFAVASMTGCRSCRVDPAPRRDPTASGDPSANEEPTRPAVTAALPAPVVTPSAMLVPNAPPVNPVAVVQPPPGADRLDWFVRELVEGHRPLAQLLDQYPRDMRIAAEKYLHCSSARDASQCSRLWSPSDTVACRTFSSQLALRARGGAGWAMPDEALQFCRAQRFSEAECRALGTAAESGTPASCASLAGPGRAMCEAIGGVATESACASVEPAMRRSCADVARQFALLRRGVAAVRANDVPSRAAAATGLEEPAACERVLRADIARLRQQLDTPVQSDGGTVLNP